MIKENFLEKLEYYKVLKYISSYAATESGKNHILKIKPLTDPSLIKISCLLVTEAKEILIKNISPPLEYLPDLSESLSQSKIEGAVLPAKRILNILSLAKISRALYKYINDNSDTAPLLKSFLDKLFINKVFEHHIEKVVDDNGDVKENASVRLTEIRKSIREKQAELTKSINRIMKSLEDNEIVREDYLTLRDGRMVIPVKAEHKRHLRGFIHSESSTGQTVYIEPEETLELNNTIISLSFEEKREIERLLKELTALIGNESCRLDESYKALTEIDSVFARAKFSIEIIGCFPGCDNLKPFFVKDARHPALLKKLGRDKSIPLSFLLNDEKVVVITGPNAGGKTVVLKTIGINLLLLQSGIHIPVHPDSNFHIFNKIILDIGDEQSIEDNLSTFSSHLLNIKSMLDAADNNTIIFVDEIGTGTDPSEGAALAAAILMKLRDLGALVFATTHHGSLKLIAQNEPGFINAAMEFDHKTLSPSYNFKMGIPGSSYAFEIAKRIGINESLLNAAENFIDSDKFKVEKFLIELEEKSNSLQNKLRQMEIENSRLAGLSYLYKTNLEKLEKEKKEILKSAKTEAKNYLQEINKKVENVIKELRESNASHSIIKKAKDIIRDAKENNDKLFSGDVELVGYSADFKVGDLVTIKGTQTSGRITSLDKEKEKVILNVGDVKMTLTPDEIIPKLISDEPEKVKNIRYDISDVPYRLDIRGKRADESAYEIIKFIDVSYVTGRDRIEILHGKGTGALKKSVREILEHHDKVKNFYFAPIESGGEGITIIELK